MASSAKLYLIPSTLGTESPLEVIPKLTLEVVQTLKHFIVENEKSARKFLKACVIKTPQNELEIYQLDKHNSADDAEAFLEKAHSGINIGLISEAGVPAVADPGNIIVRKAHELGIQVIPLVGPSSILMSLMASGLNGQQFTFHGYLPIQSADRKKALKQLEKESKSTGYTQLFIETPYRNMSMLKDILSTCQKNTKLSISTNLLQPDELCQFYTIAEWKKVKADLNKKPSVFSLQA